jgi:hypothetical protein
MIRALQRPRPALQGTAAAAEDRAVRSLWNVQVNSMETRR